MNYYKPCPQGNYRSCLNAPRRRICVDTYGVAEWGNVEIRFDNCTSGYAKLSGADGVQIFNLTKLAMQSGIHCVAW